MSRRGSKNRATSAPSRTSAPALAVTDSQPQSGNSSPKEEASIAGLKDQLALLGLVVVFVGLISTETYYAGFGVRYQDLGLSATHLLYRGLTTLIDAWELAGLYLIAIAWLATSDAIARRIGKMRAMGISYALVIALAVGAYPLARRAGFAEARRDMMRETSTLETVECLSFERGTCQPEYRRYKHLITSGGEVLLFNPVPRGQTASFPVLVHLPQGDIHELRTSPTR